MSAFSVGTDRAGHEPGPLERRRGTTDITWVGGVSVVQQPWSPTPPRGGKLDTRLAGHAGQCQQLSSVVRRMADQGSGRGLVARGWRTPLNVSSSAFAMPNASPIDCPEAGVRSPRYRRHLGHRLAGT